MQQLLGLIQAYFSNHFFDSKKILVLWVSCIPKSRIERNVVIGNLEVLARGNNVDLPPNTIHYQPMTDSGSAFIDCLERESFKI